MLNEIRGRDLLRTLALSSFSLAAISLLLYFRGRFSATAFEVALAVVVSAAVFDTFWLNAKRTRLRSNSEAPLSAVEMREKQIKLGRKITFVVSAVVVVGLTIQFLLRLWSLGH
ncbi:hypothetical protein QA648_24755 (plasmid) [Rhizobium sp. CB3171]|uniref:hypothetical protein n=1 Tax=Rhizobium sp. CB3171 TaxID=3039157 RepID=UPI0024B1560E|nr:hypothetical protein [Rhizobium sp. CB3171]WFU06319.1 hypothetical protein QA648_24755 [Rhizobium sp. CB3171]